MLVDVNVYCLHRDRGSRLVVDRYGDRYEPRLVRRRIVGEVDPCRLVSANGREAVMRNDRARGNGDGVREVAAGGIRVVDDERNAL